MEEILIGPIPDDEVDIEVEKPGDVFLNEDGQKFLNQTRPWVRFLSIMLFIGATLMAAGGAMTLLAGATADAGNGFFGGMPGGAFIAGPLYFIAAVLFLLPGIFLFRYASAIRRLESIRTTQALDSVLKHQKSFWRFIGIFSAICLVIALAVLAFSFAVIVSMFVNG